MGSIDSFISREMGRDSFCLFKPSFCLFDSGGSGLVVGGVRFRGLKTPLGGCWSQFAARLCSGPLRAITIDRCTLQAEAAGCGLASAMQESVSWADA
jgi:hypothetical protein